MSHKAGDDVGKPYRKYLINSHPYYEKLLRRENRVFLLVILYFLGNLIYIFFFQE